MSGYVELVRVLVWPILAAFALFAFYEPIRQFLTDIGKRATKLSAFGFELGLERLVEGHLEGLRGEVNQLEQAAAFPSTKAALLDQLSGTAEVDFAVIDLDRGEEWLTSRLFIFAILLKSMRHLRCFVFVETANDIRRKFIGIATPSQVRWRLAEHFPWLEETFAARYAAHSVQGRQWTLSRGLTTQLATDVVVEYLRGIQSQAPPPPEPATEWVALTVPNQPLRWEHAEWLNGDSVRRYLGPALGKSAIEDWKTRPEQELGQAVLRKSDPFVALLDSHGSFEALVQRAPGRMTDY